MDAPQGKGQIQLGMLSTDYLSLTHTHKMAQMQLGMLRIKSNAHVVRPQLTSLEKLENLLDKLVLCQQVRNRRKDDYQFLLHIVLHGHVNILLAHFGGPK